MSLMHGNKTKSSVCTGGVLQALMVTCCDTDGGDWSTSISVGVQVQMPGCGSSGSHQTFLCLQ